MAFFNKFAACLRSNHGPPVEASSSDSDEEVVTETVARKSADSNSSSSWESVTVWTAPAADNRKPPCLTHSDFDSGSKFCETFLSQVRTSMLNRCFLSSA